MEKTFRCIHTPKNVRPVYFKSLMGSYINMFVIRHEIKRSHMTEITKLLCKYMTTVLKIVVCVTPS